MDTEDLNPPEQTDLVKTSDSAEISKTENGVEKDPSYVRSRRIALKKFTLPEGGSS